VAEQIRVAIETRVFEFRSQTFKVSISQGLAEWPRDGKTPEELIAAADGALYAAKAAGRNCVRVAGE
jgi:diguanylate cyclase (GGDEF)-like protein